MIFQLALINFVSLIAISAISNMSGATSRPLGGEKSPVPLLSRPTDPVENSVINNLHEPELTFDNYLASVYDDHKILYAYAAEAMRLQDRGTPQMKQWAETAAFMVDTLYIKGDPVKKSNLKKFYEYVVNGLLDEDPVYDEFARIFRQWKRGKHQVPGGSYLVHHMKPYYKLGLSFRKKTQSSWD